MRTYRSINNPSRIRSTNPTVIQYNADNPRLRKIEGDMRTKIKSIPSDGYTVLKCSKNLEQADSVKDEIDIDIDSIVHHEL